MVIYCRISDDREGRQYGVDRQERQCRELATRNGDEVVAVFIDDDRSAYSGKRRPQYLEMLAYLRDGHADGVYSIAPTRLYRRLDDGIEFFKLISERGLEVQTVKQGRYNLGTADGRRDALRAAVDAQHESEQIGERVRDAKADNVARGEYRGGPRPFGFESDGVTVRDDEANWIRVATDAIINGDSLNGLCRLFAEHDVHTAERRRKGPDGSRGEPESRPWAPGQLRRMLVRPRNAGLLEVDGEPVGKAVWPAIVDEERWRACLAILTNPSRRTITSNARVWLLSGVAKCYCGSVVKCSSAGLGGSRKKRNPDDPDGEPIIVARPGHIAAYRCRATGGHVTRRAHELDEYIEAVVVRRLSKPDAAQFFTPPRREQAPVEDLATQANALRAKLESLAADYAADLLTRAQLVEATAVTRARIDQIEARMADRATANVLESIPLGSGEIGDLWETYDIDRKRAIISAAMEIKILPAKRGPRPGGNKGIDTESISIRWKRPGAE